jgi:hypothetical protein
MNMYDPVPDGKRCGQCGRWLKWGGHGYNELGAQEALREGIFACPVAHEVWTYVPRTQTWRKHD